MTQGENFEFVYGDGSQAEQFYSGTRKPKQSTEQTLDGSLPLGNFWLVEHPIKLCYVILLYLLKAAVVKKKLNQIEIKLLI